MWQKVVKNIFYVSLIVVSVSLSFSLYAMALNPSEQIKQINQDISVNKNSNTSNQNLVSSRMTYGRFLEYLDMGWIKQVDLYDNSRNAIVEASSPELGNRPQTIRVEIPVGASQLIQKLKESNVDFDSHPTESKNVWITWFIQIHGFKVSSII